jgi:hypothetical protein
MSDTPSGYLALKWTVDRRAGLASIDLVSGFAKWEILARDTSFLIERLEFVARVTVPRRPNGVDMLRGLERLGFEIGPSQRNAERYEAVREPEARRGQVLPTAPWFEVLVGLYAVCGSGPRARLCMYRHQPTTGRTSNVVAVPQTPLGSGGVIPAVEDLSRVVGLRLKYSARRELDVRFLEVRFPSAHGVLLLFAVETVDAHTANLDVYSFYEVGSLLSVLPRSFLDLLGQKPKVPKVPKGG